MIAQRQVLQFGNYLSAQVIAQLFVNPYRERLAQNADERIDQRGGRKKSHEQIEPLYLFAKIEECGQP